MTLKFKSKEIRRLRRDRDLTQSYMAEKLGISVSAYSKRENGQNIPVNEFIQILNILEVPEKDILKFFEKTVDN